MILSSEITIPVLCPINFSEAKETYFYPEQEMFVGKIRTRQHIQFLIPETMHEQTDKLYVKCRHIKGWITNTYEMTTYEQGSNYWYADVTANMHSDLPSNWVGYIELYFGNELLAQSTLYERASGGEYWKTIEYTNSKNDWNTIFNSSFLLSVPIGFNPTNYSAKRKVENYQDQDIQNISIYSQPYDTEIATIGAPHGVPNWMYRKLNAIFACDTIKYNSKEYKVAEGANLEKKDKTYEGLHILEIELQPLNNYAQ